MQIDVTITNLYDVSVRHILLPEFLLTDASLVRSDKKGIILHQCLL